MSQLLGYTGPVSAEQLATLRGDGLPTGRPPRQGRARSGVRDRAPRHLRCRERRARRHRPTDPGPPDRQQAAAWRVAHADHRYARRRRTPRRHSSGRWSKIGMTRGVVIAMNPQTGEILAMVSLPTYDNNMFARGISAADYAKLLKNKDKPLLNHAVQAHYAPGSTYKLVTGTGALADRKITDSTRVQTKPFLTLGSTKFYEWNHRGWGPLRHLLRLRPLERHVLLPARRQARHRPAGVLGAGSTASAARLVSICQVRSTASSRTTPGSRTRSAPRSSRARPTRRASGRAMTRSRHSS